jgi:outer membrane lipoprotein-sorting protein
VTLDLLGKEKKSKGQFLMQKGRLRMELKGDENTILVINSKKLYAVDMPPADKKDMKPNVIEANVNNSQVKKQGLMVLMAKGGFDSMFLVSGVVDSGPDQLTYYLSPKPETKGLRNAEVKIEKKEKPRLLALTYWDELNNKTAYLFTGHKKVDSLPAKTFDYTPPAGAHIEREN